MSNEASQEQLLIKKGIEWIEFHRSELLNAFSDMLLNLPVACYRQMPPLDRRRLAEVNLNKVVQRLAGHPFPTEDYKSLFIIRINQGLRLSELTLMADGFYNTFCAQAFTGLIDQPQVYRVLTRRVDHMTRLLKTAMASAMIEAQGRNLTESPKSTKVELAASNFYAAEADPEGLNLLEVTRLAADFAS